MGGKDILVSTVSTWVQSHRRRDVCPPVTVEVGVLPRARVHVPPRFHGTLARHRVLGPRVPVPAAVDRRVLWIRIPAVRLPDQGMLPAEGGIGSVDGDTSTCSVSPRTPKWSGRGTVLGCPLSGRVQSALLTVLVPDVIRARRNITDRRS